MQLEAKVALTGLSHTRLTATLGVTDLAFEIGSWDNDAPAPARMKVNWLSLSGREDVVKFLDTLLTILKKAE